MALGEAIVGEFTIAVSKSFVPRAWAWVRNTFLGKRILFVGPPRAGKTSFVTYIRAGSYVNPLLPTQRTARNRNAGKVQLRTSNQNVTIEIKKLLDTLGQNDPRGHARLVRTYRPHAICILLDIESPWTSRRRDGLRYSVAEWLREFTEELFLVLSEKRRLGRRIKTILFFVSKADTAAQPDIDVRIKQIKGFLAGNFKGEFGHLRYLTAVLELSLVKAYKRGSLPGHALTAVVTPFVRGQ